MQGNDYLMSKFISKADQQILEKKYSEEYLDWRADFKGFILMPIDIVDDNSMSDGEFRFYCKLFTIAGNDGTFWHSNEKLAELYDCSVNNIKHFLKLLKKRGAIEVLSTGIHNKRIICLTPQRLL